jgi:hypothetical protein
MYNPATQVQVPTDVDLGSYYFIKQNGCRGFPYHIPFKKKIEPTIRINIGVNEIATLCDLGASVSTIPKSSFDRLNLGSFKLTELKLHLADSNYKQVVGIKRKYCYKC